MPSLRRLIWSVPVCLALNAPAEGASLRPEADAGSAQNASVARSSEPRPEVQQALSRSASWSGFRSRYGDWKAMWNEATASPHRAYGKAIRLAGFANDAASADRSVRSFIAANPAVFGENPTLRLADASLAGDLWYVRYEQMVAGIPVLDADWEFRIGTNGNLSTFGADTYHPPIRLVNAPRVGTAVAREAAKVGIDFNAATDEVRGGDRLYILPIRSGAATDYRLVYEVLVHTVKPRASWYTLVDAATGEVVTRRSWIRDAISGNVNAQVHPLLPSDSPIGKPLKNANVTVVSPMWTDSLGNYTQSASGTVTVTSSFHGRYVDVDRCINDICGGANDSYFQKTISNPATVNIPWSNTNSQQSERDAFYHVNVAHDYVKSIDPAYTSNDYDMKTNVDFTDNCNANWDVFSNTLNFDSAGGGCPNTTSMPDVIYHEYGHSINDNLYMAHGRPQGMDNFALQEGLADVNAAFMTDDPVIGNGFFGTGTSLRTLVNTRQWPQDQNTVSPQDCGLILAGAMWNLRQSLGLATAAHLAHFAKYGLPDDPNDGVAFSEYFIEVLNADDNDHDLSNGTPHMSQIISAFDAHGIGANYFININAAVDDQPNSGPFPINATITYSGTVSGLNTSSPTLFYSINNSAFTSTPMFPTGNPDEYGAQVPASVTAVVRYYVRAADLNGGFKYSPPGAPNRWSSFLGGPYSAMYENDFESDLGWIVGAPGDAATTGIWVRDVPVGTAIQPGTPHTGTECYVTGNGAPGDGVGVADVDGGATTLLTPTFDALAGGMIRPTISYWRWYSNNGGDNPGQDPWKVQISNNNGSSWVDVENTLETDQSWRRVLFRISDYLAPTHTMKMRFIATDDVTYPSLVEAGLDDWALFGYPSDVAVDSPADHSIFALAPAAPNPFRARTQLAYTLATRGRVELGVYDLQGRSIRTLVQASQEPGHYSVAWDGHDDSGRPLPDGPYFVRLAQDGKYTSKAVVFMH